MEHQSQSSHIKIERDGDNSYDVYVPEQKWESLTQKCDDLKQECDTLKQECNTITNRFNSLVDLCDALQHERDTLYDLRDTLKIDRDHFKRRYESVRKKCYILQKRCKDYSSLSSPIKKQKLNFHPNHYYINNNSQYELNALKAVITQLKNDNFNLKKKNDE